MRNLSITEREYPDLKSKEIYFTFHFHPRDMKDGYNDEPLLRLDLQTKTSDYRNHYSIAAGLLGLAGLWFALAAPDELNSDKHPLSTLAKKRLQKENPAILDDKDPILSAIELHHTAPVSKRRSSGKLWYPEFTGLRYYQTLLHTIIHQVKQGIFYIPVYRSK